MSLKIGISNQKKGKKGSFRLNLSVPTLLVLYMLDMEGGLP